MASLAREVTQWGPACDARLLRIFGYLRRTCDRGLHSRWAYVDEDDAAHIVAAIAGAQADPTSALQRAVAGQVRGFLHTLSLKAFTDSDYAGCLRTSRSTSGWCVFLVGQCGAFSTILLDWGSKRQ